MDIFQDAALDGYNKEERQLQSVRKIVLKGAVDVVFRSSDKLQLLVAGEDADAISSVKTYFKGDKLVIEREGIVIGGGQINITSSGCMQVAGRMIFNNGVKSVVMGDIVHGKAMGPVVNIKQGHVVVGVALPEAPSIKIEGSGDVTLHDLQQNGLDLEIEGSGDITAFGQVVGLDVSIAGSGDVDASELTADHACLSIAGSGDIEAFVRSEVRARVAGSGDIVVRGNPLRRDYSVAGSGKIKFR